MLLCRLKASDGISLITHCPKSFQWPTRQCLTSPPLSFHTHSVPPSPHSLCSSHKGLPWPKHTKLISIWGLYSCCFPSFSVRLSMCSSHLPLAHHSGLSSKASERFSLPIHSLDHCPVHFCHITNLSLKCSYFFHFFVFLSVCPQ